MEYSIFTSQSTITITSQEMISIATALDMLAVALGPEEGSKYEELRQKLHRLFAEHEELVEVPTDD